MSDNTHSSAVDVFNDALEREGEEREAFLSEIEKEDPALLAEVQSLLKAHEEIQTADFLEPATGERTAATSALPAEQGECIGPYRILDQLGEGGMGSVYLAEQTEPVHRRVALKIIKLGMDTKRVIARFDLERQALAMMDHPWIAKVLDAGATDTGRPYFVMDYVQGVPITDYCDRHRLSINDRLKLFMMACEAVQHAHQKGIIHRDIKPTNILVTFSDGTPVPKVIDFGIAKATTDHLTEKTLYTEQGRLVGTPGHISPEQAEMTGLNVDTRTDIYSLGVLLYELLTGTTPFDPDELRRSGLVGIQQTIREVEPAKPSAQFSRMDAAQLGQTARQRRAGSGGLIRSVRGDLDWITMKAMDKDRTRRYATASELAADINRYMRHEPVVARHPSTTYQMKKFVVRHRFGVLVAAVIALLVAGSAVALSFTIMKVADERDRAFAAERFAISILETIDPDVARGADTSLLCQLLNTASRKVADDLAGQPLAQARMQHLIGVTYLKIGEYNTAADHLRFALSGREDSLGEEHPDVAESLHYLAWACSEQAEYDVAERYYGRSLKMRRRLLGDESLEVAASLNDLGVLHFNTKEYGLSEEYLREGLRLREPHEEDQPDAVVESLATLGSLLRAKGNEAELDESEQLLRRALRLANDRKDELGECPATVAVMNKLGLLLLERYRYREAEPLLARALHLRRRLLPDRHKHIAVSLHNLALALCGLEQYEDAIRYHHDALDAWEVAYAVGREHPDYAQGLRGLAATLRASGDLDQAEITCRKALDILNRGEGVAMNVADARYVLGTILMDKEECAAAEAQFRESLDYFESHKPNHWMFGRAQIALGGALLALNRFDEADQLLTDGLDQVRATRPSRYKLLLEALHCLVELYEATDEQEKAADCVRQISEIEAAHSDATP